MNNTKNLKEIEQKFFCSINNKESYDSVMDESERTKKRMAADQTEISNSS